MLLKLILIACFVFSSAVVSAENVNLPVFKIGVADVVEWEEQDDSFLIVFNEKMAKSLCSITGENVGKRIEFYFEGILLNSPRVNERICSGKISFFKFEQQKYIIKRLEEGEDDAP